MKNRIYVFILLFIFLIGAVLRFYHFDVFSLTNDELSAIFRTKYNSFSELIDLGVLATDPHPAGVQIFMFYWLKIFGDSAFWVRLPFVILSVCSILVVAALTRTWFGNISSLCATAVYAVLEFPIMYGQIARPYSVGLFFGLLTAWAWTYFIRKEMNWKWGLLYAISATAAAYSHYFSGLFVFMVGVSGMFLLDRKQLITYLVVNSVVLILFFPHLRITLHQLNVGGLSGWLPKPDVSFISDHFFLLSNNSWIFVITVVLALIFATRKPQGLGNGYLRVISLIWFVFPFILGYVYSVFFESVLMHRVLLFSFPFLFIFLFSFTNDSRSGFIPYLSPLLIVSIGFFTTVFQNKFYAQRHFEDFEVLAQEVYLADEKLGAESITHTINLNSEKYIQYYLDRMGHEVNFKHNQTILDSSLVDLMRTVKSSRTPYFMNGWACIYQPPEVSEIIRTKYPKSVRKMDVFNTGFTLYGRGNPNDYFIFSELQSFDFLQNPDSILIDQLDSLYAYQSKVSFRVDAGLEYSLTREIKGRELLEMGLNKVSVSAQMYFPRDIKGVWVISIERNGQPMVWLSADVKDYIRDHGSWQEVFLTAPIPEGLKKSDVIKIYFWNNERATCWIDNVRFLGSRL